MKRIAKDKFDSILTNISEEEDKNTVKSAYCEKEDCFSLNEDVLKDDKRKKELLSILEPYIKDLPGNGTASVDINMLGEGALEKLLIEFSSLKVKLSEYEELIKRKQAEFENYKRRTLKEREQFKIFANQKLFLELFPIMDAIEKAVDIPKERLGVDSLLEGIVLIEKQLGKVFENNGVFPIGSIDKEFNPDLHEAIQVEEAGEGELYQVDTVVKEWQRGYIAKDKVLRHAKVVIVKENTGKESTSSSIPSTITDNMFSALLGKLDGSDSKILEGAYEKGEGQYIIKDFFIGNEGKRKEVEEIFYKLGNI